MKKMMIAAMIAASVTMTACGSGSTQSQAPAAAESVAAVPGAIETGTTGDPVELGSLEDAPENVKAALIGLIPGKVNELASVDVNFPEASEWTITKSTSEDGRAFYSFVVEGTQATDGHASMVSGWLEAKDDVFVLHYLDDYEGVILDDGVIVD